MEKFTKALTGSNIIISNNGKTVTSKGGGIFSNLHNAIGCAPISKNKRYKWTMRINKSGGYCMFVGITSSQKHVDGSWQQLDYLYDCILGNICNFGKEKRYGGPEGKAGDMIGLIVNMNTKEISIEVNGQNKGVIFRNIPPHTYYMVVSIKTDSWGTGDSMSLTDFSVSNFEEKEEKEPKDTKAGHDPATNLPMKSIMYNVLNTACNNNVLNIAVCSADMDGMKYLNDTFGHQVTDNIIKSIALIMANHAKGSKVISVYRMNAGGDEFAMIVKDTNNNSVFKWADHLRKEIDNSTKAKISIGVTMRRNKETKIEWFERAEDALKKAKKEGKNRVVLL